MTTLVSTLALLCLGLAASALPQMPVLYLREPGSDLQLDPRVQRKAPAFYTVDPERYQREVPVDDEEDDDPLDNRPKRKTPLSFLFFEQDGRSQKKDSDLNPEEADTDNEDAQDMYNGFPSGGQEAKCNNFICNSQCLASSQKQNGGRCQAGRCVCSETKSKKRHRKFKKSRKPSRKIPKQTQ